MVKHNLILLLSSSVSLLLPIVNGFSPTHTTSHHQTIVNSLSLTNHHHLVGQQLPAAASAAFSNHPPTRLLFTPKEDNDDDKPFIQSAIHNSPFFRSLAILYALLFAIYQGSNVGELQKLSRFVLLSPKAAATVHLLSFSTWFGSVVYTTFVAGITMFKNLPRRVFGKIQAKLFPLYFQLGSALLSVQILTLIAMPDILSKTSEVSLGVAFIATLLNLLFLEPKSTRIMFDRYQLEDEGLKTSDEYSEKAKAFGRLHGISSLANLVALCGGIVHAVRLASSLVI